MRDFELNKTKRSFEYDTSEGKAVVEYRKKESTYILTHTEVPPALEGEGVASSLVRDVLKHIREEGCKVTPLCAYIDKYMERHSEWNDLRT